MTALISLLKTQRLGGLISIPLCDHCEDERRAVVWVSDKETDTDADLCATHLLAWVTANASPPREDPRR